MVRCGFPGPTNEDSPERPCDAVDERMERITRQAVGRWLSHPDGEDLAQEARLAYWQSPETDSDALLVVKVRRRAIDAWRRMTRSKESPSDALHEQPVHDHPPYDAAHLGLPDGWRRLVERVANGQDDLEPHQADGIRIFLETTGRVGEVSTES